jgi:hypothetical protein
MARIDSALVVVACAALAACTSDASVDPAATLPGTWKCDDEIVLTLETDGRYEWAVLPGGPLQVGFATDESEHHRVEPDGSYSLLGRWRLSERTLELDMLGDTDRYQVAFSGHGSVSLKGPETYRCKRV